MTGIPETVGETSLMDILTSRLLATICTHLAAAAFGGMAFLIRFGQHIDARPICSDLVRGGDHPCVELATWQQSMQLDLAVIGLGLVLVAAAITVYNQERGEVSE